MITAGWVGLGLLVALGVWDVVVFARQAKARRKRREWERKLLDIRIREMGDV